MVETYTVELVDQNVTLEVPVNKSLLKAAEQAGINLPYQCRMGICGVCCAMRENNCEVDQSEGMFLSESEKDEGFVLTCVGTPLSDMQIRINESP
jgi:ferredoxin